MQVSLYKQILRSGVLLLLGSLAGCATLDRDECLVADWRLIGYRDGAAGKSVAVLDRYREDCAGYAVTPDLDAYRAGRAEGLREYCRSDNGYRLGENGRGYPAVCPAELDAGFRDAWHRGRELYLARSAVRSTRSQISSHRRTLQDLEANKTAKLTELIAIGLTPEQRVLVLYEITELEKQKHGIEEEIDALEYDLAGQQARLDTLLTQQAAR